VFFHARRLWISSSFSEMLSKIAGALRKILPPGAPRARQT